MHRTPLTEASRLVSTCAVAGSARRPLSILPSSPSNASLSMQVACSEGVIRYSS